MAIETFQANGFIVDIDHDYDPDSPRNWTVGCQLVMGHKRYDFPNDAGIDFDQFSGWQEIGEHLKAEGALMVLPVYMIDHSGLAFRVDRDFSDVDPGNWDSGVIGLAYVTPQNWKDTQGSEWTGSEADTGQARNLITSEVEVYGQYVNGDVYCYAVRDFDGEVVDSCCGMYGYDYAKDEATAAAEAQKHEVKCSGTLDRRTGQVGHTGSCPLCGCEKTGGQS